MPADTPPTSEQFQLVTRSYQQRRGDTSVEVFVRFERPRAALAPDLAVRNVLIEATLTSPEGGTQRVSLTHAQAMLLSRSIGRILPREPNEYLVPKLSGYLREE